jgi:hypothetical protein
MTALLKHLLQRVRTGDIRYAHRLTRSLTVVVLDHNGEELTFLYSSARKRILKLLAAGAAETAQYQKTLRKAPR